MRDDETFQHRDRCAISGIGWTDFSRDSGRSELTLATQASLAAITDAGLTPQDIDGIVRCDMDLVRPNDLVDALGMTRLDYYGDAGPGGVAPTAQVAQAVAAVISGQATNVLVYRSLNGRSGRRFGLSSVTSSRVGGNGTYDEFFLPYGLLTPGQIFGLIAQRHMLEYGTNEKDLGAIAIACRNRANQNPRAQMHDRALTMDDYLAARMISRPLRLFDFCLETDGAAAVIVTSAERARDCAQPAGADPGRRGRLAASTRSPASSSPSCCATTSRRCPASRPPTRCTGGPGSARPTSTSPSSTTASRSPCCCSSRTSGSAPRARAGAFVSSGAIELGGSLPINTGGGHLSEGYIHGMNHIVEGVRQIRGTSTSQVPGAEVCLVTTPAAPGQRPDPAEGLVSDTASRPMLSPVTDDRDTGGFFEAAARGELALRACTDVRHRSSTSPGPTAGSCGSWDGEWRVVGGTGTLHSWTVADHQVHPAYPVPVHDRARRPRRRARRAPARPPARQPRPHVGMPMQVRFEERPDGAVLPNWEPAPAGPTTD